VVDLIARSGLVLVTDMHLLDPLQIKPSAFSASTFNHLPALYVCAVASLSITPTHPTHRWSLRPRGYGVAARCTGEAYHIISYHIISHHIISHHIHITSYHIISYHITSHHIISHIISHRYHDACMHHIISLSSYHIISQVGSPLHSERSVVYINTRTSPTVLGNPSQYTLGTPSSALHHQAAYSWGAGSGQYSRPDTWYGLRSDWLSLLYYLHGMHSSSITWAVVFGTRCVTSFNGLWLSRRFNWCTVGTLCYVIARLSRHILWHDDCNSTLCRLPFVFLVCCT
jgi:hypothetical protein